MNFREIGERIAKRTYDEQLLAGAQFLADLKGALPNAEQSAVLAVLMTKILGTAVVENVPGYVGTVTSAPNTGEGLDFPVPSLVMQVDGNGAFVDLWWKSGAENTSWVSLSGLNWEHIDFNPSTGGGLDRELFKLVWQDSLDDTPVPLALWLKTGASNTAWQKIWPISVPSPPAKSELLPLPDGDEAALGNEGKWADGQHIHPKTRPTKIRYYLSDTLGTGDYAGNLLLTTNPYSEANAIDYEEPNQSPPWAVFVSSLGSPGLAVWQGGVVHAHLRVKLINPQVGRTYKLYTGNGDIVYTAMIWDWTHSDTYQVKESAPEQPTITATYADLDFDLPVAALAAGTDGRLGLNMRLRVYVDNDEAVFSNEKIVIRIGGDNASYLDTLFTPDGGFSGEHNDLDGRSEANCHPMSAITPGRILTPSNAVVTPVDGLFTVPSNSNYVEVDGTDDVIGISTTGWTGTNSRIDVFFFYQRVLKRGQDVPDGYASLAWGTSEAGYGVDIDTLTVYADCVVSFRLIGGRWRIVGMLNL